MPYGEVVSFNENTGHGRIESSGRWFVVDAEDMDAKSRTTRAKVDFDIRRDKPHDRAINVRLREGTHNAPTQRRFGEQR